MFTVRGVSMSRIVRFSTQGITVNKLWNPDSSNFLQETRNFKENNNLLPILFSFFFFFCRSWNIWGQTKDKKWELNIIIEMNK